MEKRILIYAPAGQNAALTGKVLGMAHIDSHVCETVNELREQLALGAGALVTVEEALSASGYRMLSDYVSCQPEWSDLPVLLLTHKGGDSLMVRCAVVDLGNLTLLERPVRTVTLIAAVQAMLRARDKQYQVREANRRKDEFLASLGHELRNPLAPIRTSAKLLTQLFPHSEPAARIKDVVERQVVHLTRLVDDLLDVARITSGKIQLQRQPVVFGEVMRHVIELCMQSAIAKRIRLDQDLPGETLYLDADYARVVQIYSNILSNAIKFTPQGGQVGVRAWRDGHDMCVSIRDSGIGLDAEAIPTIFNMFEQSRTVSGQISSGLGIGLSLARQFAQMHGGSVEAYSEGAGKGSEFVIRLPLPEQTPAAAPCARAAQPARDRKGRVLVVDDNRDAADSLGELFKMENFDVGTAYDGYAAVAAATEVPPDLIVMDLGMPGMDGYEAARLIRQHPGAEHILMVALTGWGQNDARRRTLDAGFDCHLIKPVDFDDLLRLADKGRQAA
ncbi:hybrid sensor histidine kinase/response regulator [Pseudoduganella namucuonensis]|uniref:histidine kinase n=1 Tax=Pseudoduganella namucuonensis TaxID=1035707 RepID=A0A1I7IXX7_9BURK|nr:response regulator [Pseudoduganella namucuonensis]SFU77754.1 Signal transduction histidine kinase [Pseudoduganella namucuonensis]